MKPSSSNNLVPSTGKSSNPSLHKQHLKAPHIDPPSQYNIQLSHRKESIIPSNNVFETVKINDKEELEMMEKEMRKRKLLQNASPFHKMMYEFTESMLFNGFIMVVILMNTAILCALTYEIVAVRLGWYMTFVDYIFLVIYFLECVVKLYVWRLGYFKEAWNIVDFLIVLCNIADLLVPVIMGNEVNILQFLSILRSMRALRALRVLRTVRFLNSLQVIMNTCLQSMQSMGAIVSLIFLFLYMFAVIGRGLYSEVDPDRFGNLTSAMFTMFQLLTLDDWFYIYTDAVKRDPGSFHIIFYLMMYIATEYFIFLNLFVAVLVDNFQLTLEAAAEADAERKAALKAEEEEQNEKHASMIERQKMSENLSLASSVEVPHIKRTIDDYYDEHKYNSGDRKSLGHLFQLFAAIEYQGHVLRNQQGTLSKVIELVQETVDDV
ncbi:cation channel sperm-associated protein 1-like [Antedon mediterranea]|uniref:cation channel sperm-associated protein 1-like n=1 Tax=Antedon mediterranea TaxID=105859 RepID=UPI003AF7B188